MVPHNLLLYTIVDRQNGSVAPILCNIVQSANYAEVLCDLAKVKLGQGQGQDYIFITSV